MQNECARMYRLYSMVAAWRRGSRRRDDDARRQQQAKNSRMNRMMRISFTTNKDYHKKLKKHQQGSLGAVSPPSVVEPQIALNFGASPQRPHHWSLCCDAHDCHRLCEAEARRRPKSRCKLRSDTPCPPLRTAATAPRPSQHLDISHRLPRCSSSRHGPTPRTRDGVTHTPFIRSSCLPLNHGKKKAPLTHKSRCTFYSRHFLLQSCSSSGPRSQRTLLSRGR